MSTHAPKNAVVKLTVDLDGPNKGKSIQGRDVFLFSIGAKDDNGKRMGLTPGLFNMQARSDLYNNVDNCKTSNNDIQTGNAIVGGRPGSSCSISIYRNNFKLPYNPNIFANTHKN